MASICLLIFFFIMGLAPQIFGADKMIECLLATPAKGEFVPCGKNITVTMHPNSRAHYYEYALLKIDCKESTPQKKITYTEDVQCCANKDCTSMFKPLKADVLMQCIEPKTCNAIEDSAKMRSTTCSLLNCTFSKKTFPPNTKPYIPRP